MAMEMGFGAVSNWQKLLVAWQTSMGPYTWQIFTLILSSLYLDPDGHIEFYAPKHTRFACQLNNEWSKETFRCMQTEHHRNELILNMDFS